MKKLFLSIIIGFVLLFVIIYWGLGNTLVQVGLTIHNLGTTIKRFEDPLRKGGKDKVGDINDLINGKDR